MIKFKIGDIVRLDPEYNRNDEIEMDGLILRFDRDYHVKDFIKNFIIFEEIDGGWMSERFKLVKEKNYVLDKGPKKFGHDRFNKLVQETFDKVNELSELKGGEYAGDVDRLDNFRRNGLAMELPMEVIWHTYIAKHWDAVTQYCKDMKDGKKRNRLESLSGRLDDIILYSILMKAMLLERGEEK